MTPWYKKRKFAVAIITAIAYGVGSYSGNKELTEGLLFIGMTLIAALGLEDFGKARDEIIELDNPKQLPKL